MSKFCPIVGRREGGPLLYCGDRCALYSEKGCIIKQALETYIVMHTPIKTIKTELNKEDIDHILELFKSSSEANPILYKMPDEEPKITPSYINIDQEDWYPHGLNDIAP